MVLVIVRHTLHCRNVVGDPGRPSAGMYLLYCISLISSFVCARGTYRFQETREVKMNQTSSYSFAEEFQKLSSLLDDPDEVGSG